MCARIQTTATYPLEIILNEFFFSLLDQMSNERAMFGRQQKKEREEFRRCGVIF